jgi:type VI secretion system protein ImpJ
MTLIDKVLWTKGVLLTPQHLQVQDRYLEDLIGFRTSALTVFPWGFSRLSIDHEALAGGVLALKEAAGLMPDGLPFDVPNGDAPPSPRPLEGFWMPDQATLDLYLSIAEPRPGGFNVSANAADRGTRYVAEVVLRRDENTGQMEKPIQVARKNFRLLIEGETLDGFAALPVARVVKAGTGEIGLDPNFVPPLVAFGASEYLVSLVRRLVEILSARSAALSATRRQRNRGLADFGVSDVANFWLLYTINSHLPVLRHILETRRHHPADLFASLLSLAGTLSTFSSDVHPRMLPAYDHGHLGECFTGLDTQIRELLETVVPASHVTLGLRLMEPSIYATAIEHDRYLSAPAIYLAVSANTAPEELLRNAPRLMKVSSASQIQRLIRQALPGVSLRPMAAAPSSLPVKLDYQYFALETTGQDWEAISRERNLSVYVPADFPDPKLELLVLLPRER